MRRTHAQKLADKADRQSAATDVETAMVALITDIQTYLAAGSGDRVAARTAVRDWVNWKLSALGVTQAPGHPHAELSAVDFETPGDLASDY